jgi:FAD:protein FMN transferase
MLVETKFARRVMGSALRVTVASDALQHRGASQTDPEACWRAISEEFDAADAALSNFRTDSGLAELNRRAGDLAPRPVERRLYDAVVAADRARRVTGGAFDPRVLVDLVRLGHPVAATDAVKASRRSPAGPWLTRAPRARAVAISAPIDLGGIGKGLALRWAMRRLAALGVRFGPSFGVMIDAGGDIVAAGTSPQGGSWLVGIEDPGGGSDPLAVVSVQAGAVCTSSIRLARWTAPDGSAVHHLIDPATGEPGGGGLVAVSVAMTDPAWSEVWSKALFLAGPGNIATRARAHGLAAWWIDDRGEVSMTPAARLKSTWTR